MAPADFLYNISLVLGQSPFDVKKFFATSFQHFMKTFSVLLQTVTALLDDFIGPFLSLIDIKLNAP